MRPRPWPPVFLGLLGVLIPTLFVAVPAAHEDSRVYQHVGMWALAWHVQLLAGGVLILRGWWTRQLDIEAMGHVLVACGGLFYVVAAFGVAGWGAETSGLWIAGAAGAQLGRVHAAWKGQTP